MSNWFFIRRKAEEINQKTLKEQEAVLNVSRNERNTEDDNRRSGGTG